MQCYRRTAYLIPINNIYSATGGGNGPILKITQADTENNTTILKITQADTENNTMMPGRFLPLLLLQQYWLARLKSAQRIVTWRLLSVTLTTDFRVLKPAPVW